MDNARDDEGQAAYEAHDLADADLSAHLVADHGQRPMWATFAHPRALILKHDRLHATTGDLPESSRRLTDVGECK